MLSHSASTIMNVNPLSTVEILTAEELAGRLKVKVGWVNEMKKPSKSIDPIPVVRFGKHVRFGWNSSKLNAWLARNLGV